MYEPLPIRDAELERHILKELRDCGVSPPTRYFLAYCFELLAAVSADHEKNRQRVARHRARKAIEAA